MASRHIIFLFLLGFAYCQNTSVKSPDLTITNPFKGIWVIGVKGVTKFGTGIQGFSGCLTQIGQFTSLTIGETLEDVVDTFISAPKVALNFGINEWPKFLGGTLLKKQRDLTGHCVSQSINDKAVQLFMQGTLACFGKPVISPLMNLKGLSCKIKKILVAAPGEVKGIGKADTLSGMGKNCGSFMSKASKSILSVGFSAGKTGLSVGLGMPSAILCIGKEDVIKNPYAIVKSIFGLGSCMVNKGT